MGVQDVNQNARPRCNGCETTMLIIYLHSMKMRKKDSVPVSVKTLETVILVLYSLCGLSPVL